ncbi:MAG: hypothetical protein R3350_07790 [Saprospiraceae bacterium]|nr:hypothetical protein [Saprospiraceae bacterium]
MRKILFLGLAIGLMVACQREKSAKEEMAEAIGEEIKANLPNPESYEFVALDIQDTITYLDNLYHMISTLERRQRAFTNALQQDSTELDELRASGDQEALARKEQRIETLTRVLNKDTRGLDFLIARRDSVLSSAEPQQIAAYFVQHRFNAQLSDTTDVAETSLFAHVRPETYEVIKFYPQKNRLEVTPGGYPGQEVYERDYR